MAPLPYAAKCDSFLSLDWAPHSPTRRNPRKGRDQILPSGNTGGGGRRGHGQEEGQGRGRGGGLDEGEERERRREPEAQAVHPSELLGQDFCVLLLLVMFVKSSNLKFKLCKNLYK